MKNNILYTNKRKSKSFYLAFTTLLTLSALLLALNVKSQDIHFSQLLFTPSTVNPALAGANYNNLGAIAYKNQWQSINSAYKTIYGSYDQRITSQTKQRTSNGFWAGGVGFYSDKAGDSNMGTTTGNVSFAYHVQLEKKHTLGVAIQPGFASRSINIDGIKWGTQYEEGVGYNNTFSNNENVVGQSFNYFDLGAGVVYSFKSSEKYLTANDKKSMNMGIAAYHITSPVYSYTNNSEEKLSRRYSVFANGMIGIQNSNLSLLPGIYYNRQGKQEELLLGTYFRYLVKSESHYTGLLKASAISFGPFLRAKDAVALKLMFEYQQYSFGFSYDINTSNLNHATQAKGGIEIAIKFASPNPFGSNSSARFY